MKAYTLINQQKSLFFKNSLLGKAITSLTSRCFSTNEIDFKQYEQEWNKAYEQKSKANKEIVEKELSEYQKKEVKTLLQLFKKLSKEEKKYYSILVKNKMILMNGENPMNANFNIPSAFMGMETIIPKGDWFKTDSMKATMASFSGAPTSQAAAPATKTATEEKAEKKPAEEQKMQKNQYDIKLASFDAGKKIALIKEVRGWLNLGLKEAKELVEKAPVELKKGVAKNDAEQIKKKLADIGAVIELL